MVLEDAVGLTLRRLFAEKLNASLSYDSAAGGADFIIRQNGNALIIEVGYGAKKIKQAVRTMKKVRAQSAYGVIVSDSPLTLHADENVVNVPIPYFLLI